MSELFLGKFMGNEYRARLLRIFALNDRESFTLLQAARRAGMSTKKVMEEMRFLENLDIVRRGRHKELTWSLNPQFKYSTAISRFVHEVSPLKYDTVLVALRRTGRPTAVILSGCFIGDPTRPADILIAADGINEEKLERTIKSLEAMYGREIRYAAFTTPEFRYRLTVQDRLIRDTLDFPHLVLLDKTRML